MATSDIITPPDIPTDDLRLLRERVEWLLKFLSAADVLSIRAGNGAASIGITAGDLKALVSTFERTTPPCLWEHYSADIGYRSGCGYHYYANTLNADLMAHERTLYKYCPHCGGELIAPDFGTPHDDSTT